MKDLVVLVADNNMKAGIEGILKRHRALKIRPVQHDIFVHPERDPGVLNKAHDFLCPFTTQYRYAMVMFEREGCGREATAEKLQMEVQGKLDRVDWRGRSSVVVLEPELETWVWSDSPHVAKILGLKEDKLSTLLENYSHPDYPKPIRPKEAMEKALRQARIPRSSSLYAELASKVSLMRCTDVAFVRLKTILQRWFPNMRNTTMELKDSFYG